MGKLDERELVLLPGSGNVQVEPPARDTSYDNLAKDHPHYTRDQVNLRPATSRSRSCVACAMWTATPHEDDPASGKCDFGFFADADDTCDKWTVKSANKVGPHGYSHGWVKANVPEVMYHGTPSAERADSILNNGFDDSHLGENSGNRGWAGEGVYLTERPEYAATYGISGDDGKVVSAKVNVKNPWDSSMASRSKDDVWSFQNDYRAANPGVTQSELSAAIRAEAESRGHDSVIQRGYSYRPPARHGRGHGQVS
jgi:hypothetical protein